MNANELIRNQNEWTLEELAPYVDHYVAWTEEGKKIAAHAPTLEELVAKMSRLGITEFVTEFIAPPDEVCLGGAILYLFDPEIPY